jgi:outer membrane protein OmpU
MIARRLLGTTALVGIGLLPATAGAATVQPGGALDVTVSGFARFLTALGERDNARLDDNVSSGPDFFNDTEVHFKVMGRHEPTGLRYGGTIELEADTDATENAGETWIFVRGALGELRFGDEDGPVDASAIGGYTIAAGTGGIDGTVVDTIATSPVYLDNTNDATKIRYYTPSFGGFSVGVSYTPQQVTLNSGADNGDALAPKNVQAQNFVEGALVYEGEFAGTGVLASITGAVCDWKGTGGNSCGGIYGGANVDLFGFKLGGGYGTEKFGNTEKDFFNAGVGAALGPVNASVNYGKVVNSDNLTFGSPAQPVDEPSNLVVSADVALMPGVVLAGDVGWFDNDRDGGGPTGDQGWQAVGRLGVAF